MTVDPVILEAHHEVQVGGIPLLVAASVADSPVLAGGPMTVTWTLTSMSSDPVHVELGGERVTGRIAGFSFDGRLEGADVSFADPSKDAIDLGGPVGTVEISSTPLPVALLVNQYLTIEAARQAIPRGEQRLLELRCCWDLVLAPRAAQRTVGEPVPIKLALRMPLRRDDQELASLIRVQIAALLASDRQSDDALAALAALRYPESTSLLTGSGGDPTRIAWATAGLQQHE